jgi:hypothetical protein
MNRFRTKKKAKDDAVAPRPSQDGDSSNPFKLFGKSKKSNEEEPKKEIDISAALPSTDDFRTSLLMSGLSARFSMLREQDDPHTKIGKASDDSVLFPKRQSRLADFGYGGGLADIAEVESIRAPPFARIDSFHSTDADSTNGGSIMNRAKPVEGNVLFGGRQKVNLGSRTVYEDDISMSPFQKWKAAERAGRNLDDDRQRPGIDTLNSDIDSYMRPESPPLSYNHKRETNSTMSSAPSVGRNSTAATSITSQPTPSVKDWQAITTAPSSACPTPVVERNVMRTRRLYEQGLSNDLHEQQSSALSRIDTLSRQRNLGSRTPDLAQNSNSPSPTTNLFGDRFGDRRILAKASAPNLRSLSPPTSGSSLGGAEHRIPSLPEKPTYGGIPPLSPPISEAEDQNILPIQPNDRGKATALGVFQKPLQAYDENKYAQRQLQLQNGRETPTQRFRAESNASYATGISRSSSSAQKSLLEKPEPLTLRHEPTVEEAPKSATFLDDSDAEPLPETTKPTIPQPSVPRPSDRDHPAFRGLALDLPTPLSLSPKYSNESSPLDEQADISNLDSQEASSVDSPTLGPATAGLSGMVRQHLRSDSNASSIYGVVPNHASELFTKPLADKYDPSSLADLGVKSNPWDPQDALWSPSYSDNEKAPERNMRVGAEDRQSTILEQPESPELPPPRDDAFDEAFEKEHAEFARELADGARRVRERLTSYVESDNSRSGSPHYQSDQSREAQTPRNNPLFILKQKSSRGSLIDRSRDMASSSKAMKMLGIGSSTISSAPSPSKGSFDEKEDSNVLVEEQEPDAHEDLSPPKQQQQLHQQLPVEDEKDEGMHAGLKAFRQARRELQKLREFETLQRHQQQNPQQHLPPPPQSGLPSIPNSQTPPTRERGTRQRTPSRERKPPPVFYQQRAPSVEPQQGSNGSRNASRPPSRTERDRSGSDTSGGRSHSRPPRLRNPNMAYEEHQYHQPMKLQQRPARSPGLPGTDIRRSPHMPPQPYPGAAPSPTVMTRSASSNNLHVQPPHYHGLDSGHPSPISPMNGLPSPYMMNSGASTPTGVLPSPRRPSAPPVPSFDTNTAGLDQSMKKFVNKRDISEPTFVSSTNRVPTVNLPPEAEGNRSRSNSRARSGSLLGASSTPNLLSGINAPPLPPINPKRRNVIGNFIGRSREDDMTASSPNLPMVPIRSPMDFDDSRSAFSISDDENGNSRERRRLRKNTNELNGMNGKFRSTRGGSPPYGSQPGMAPSIASTTRLPGGMI